MINTKRDTEREIKVNINVITKINIKLKREASR